MLPTALLSFRRNFLPYNERKIKGGMRIMRRYTAGSFIFDLFMTALSGGLWLIWIFVREMRGIRGD